jgi:hypothetical protein
MRSTISAFCCARELDRRCSGAHRCVYAAIALLELPPARNKAFEAVVVTPAWRRMSATFLAFEKIKAELAAPPFG